MPMKIIKIADFEWFLLKEIGDKSLLLAKDSLYTGYFDDYSNVYENSELHTFLNESFAGILAKDNFDCSNIVNGIWPLSVGQYNIYAKDALTPIADTWFLRSPTSNQYEIYCVDTDGEVTEANITDTLGIRPGFMVYTAYLNEFLAQKEELARLQPAVVQPEINESIEIPTDSDYIIEDNAVNTPEIVDIPEVIDIPEVVDAPEVIDTPEAVVTPEIVDVPEIVDTPKAVVASEVVDTSKSPTETPKQNTGVIEESAFDDDEDDFAEEIINNNDIKVTHTEIIKKKESKSSPITPSESPVIVSDDKKAAKKKSNVSYMHVEKDAFSDAIHSVDFGDSWGMENANIQDSGFTCNDEVEVETINSEQSNLDNEFSEKTSFTDDGVSANTKAYLDAEPLKGDVSGDEKLSQDTVLPADTLGEESKIESNCTSKKTIKGDKIEGEKLSPSELTSKDKAKSENLDGTFSSTETSANIKDEGIKKSKKLRGTKLTKKVLSAGSFDKESSIGSDFVVSVSNLLKETDSLSNQGAIANGAYSDSEGIKKSSQMIGDSQISVDKTVLVSKNSVFATDAFDHESRVTTQGMIESISIPDEGIYIPEEIERAAKAQRINEENAARERERLAILEKEKLATLEKERQEAMERERQAAIEREQQAILEKERLEAFEREKQEAVERAKQEAIEKARQEALEKEQQAAIERERLAALEKERLEAFEKEKQEAVERAKQEAIEKAQQEALEKEQQAAIERERLAALEKERLEAIEKAKQEAIEKARLAAIEKEKQEAFERDKAALLEKEKTLELERAKLEKEMLAAEERKKAEEKRIREEKEAERKKDSWLCTCGASNTGKFCVECGRPQNKTTEDWTCQCGSVNTAKFCPICGASKDRPTEAPLKNGVLTPQIPAKPVETIRSTTGNPPKKNYAPTEQKSVKKTNNSTYEENNKTVRKGQAFILSKLGVDTEENPEKTKMSDIVSQYSSTPVQEKGPASKGGGTLQQQLETALEEIEQLKAVIVRNNKQIASLKVSLLEVNAENEALIETVDSLMKKQ